MSTEQERALVGAALLDSSIGDLLVAELTEADFTDPTARLVFWTLLEDQRVTRLLDLEGVPVELSDEEALTDLEGYAMTLDCRGLLEAAGGMAAIEALVEDRPALRAALAAGRQALGAMAPVEGEAMVELARELLEAEELRS